jgi:hypothetical protein
LIQDIFRALVIAQPFLWMWIIEDDRWKVLNDVNADIWFSICAYAWISLIILFDVNIGFFSAELLILYALMVWASTMILIRKHFFSFRKAISNSFLIVYLNSYYWESFLHLWAINENGFNMNQVFQALRLIPAVYFIFRYKFDVKEASDHLLMGFSISALIGVIRIYRLWKYLPIVYSTQTVYFFNHGLMILNRLICLVYLFDAIIIWGMHKADYLKLMDKQRF